MPNIDYINYSLLKNTSRQNQYHIWYGRIGEGADSQTYKSISEIHLQVMTRYEVIKLLFFSFPSFYVTQTMIYDSVIHLSHACIANFEQMVSGYICFFQWPYRAFDVYPRENNASKGLRLFWRINPGQWHLLSHQIKYRNWPKTLSRRLHSNDISWLILHCNFIISTFRETWKDPILVRRFSYVSAYSTVIYIIWHWAINSPRLHDILG